MTCTYKKCQAEQWFKSVCYEHYCSIFGVPEGYPDPSKPQQSALPAVQGTAKLMRHVAPEAAGAWRSPGWYWADDLGEGMQRFWNGAQWTPAVRRAAARKVTAHETARIAAILAQAAQR